MQILVTGAYGQLGSEIKLLTENYPEWEFQFTDIDTFDITNELDIHDFFSKKKFDFIINCAAYTAVDKAESDEQTAHLVNAEAPKLLARQAKSTGTKLIHISTDYVFAGDACIPYTETELTHPQGVYGRTKLEGENNVLAENPNAVILRTSWLYSTFGNNFVKTMLRLGKERGELNVVFDQVGSPTYAADLAKAILLIISSATKNEKNFVPGIYHFSNEGVASWFDFAKAIFYFAKIECKVNPVLSDQFPTPAKRPHFSVFDKAKIKNTYGIEISYWRKSLKQCIKKLGDK